MPCPKRTHDRIADMDQSKSQHLSMARGHDLVRSSILHPCILCTKYQHGKVVGKVHALNVMALRFASEHMVISDSSHAADWSGIELRGCIFIFISKI